jgi:putative PEP-CTERM system histidine kinase
MVLQVAAHFSPFETAVRFEGAATLFRMLVSVAALVLVQALHSSIESERGQGVRALVLSLGALWLIDLNFYGGAYLSGGIPGDFVALRGGALVLVSLAMALAIQRKGEWNVVVSRTVAYQSLSLVAIGLYFALLALATGALATLGGANARILQTAFVFGSTAAILTMVSSPWLRAWAKVKLAKHFFRHRYDYRSEWIRFTETLAAPDGAAQLETRVVKAIADLTDSPAGVLLVPEDSGLGLGATWRWERETLPADTCDAALAHYLATSNRIVELDAVRAGNAPEDAAAVPQWMIDIPGAWALVPLPHLGSLAGAVLLARPPVQRAFDWEDFDLLKVAGRQGASVLAEARAQSALAEAQRFDEFNRRFAFILHDIKNLVSQLALVARNAERHADNPEFRADMVATLKLSVERMNGLLARLSQHHRSRTDPMRAVEALALAERVALAKRTLHSVHAEGDPGALALADPARLEQLLGHLVQNAIEASPTGTPVTLVVGREGDQVTIDVVDQGRGMAPAFVRDKLFKPFVSSKEGGFGIGAFEALQLATAMDGRIEVTSREGQGSRFRVILKPARPSELDGLGRAA